jgi:hypothetical protein
MVGFSVLTAAVAALTGLAGVVRCQVILASVSCCRWKSANHRWLRAALLWVRSQVIVAALVLFLGLDILPLYLTALHGWGGMVRAIEHSSEVYAAGVTSSAIHVFGNRTPYTTCAESAFCVFCRCSFFCNRSPPLSSAGILTGGLLASLWMFGLDAPFVVYATAARSVRHVKAAGLTVALLLVCATSACCTSPWL